jgi:hypothetical protein
LIVSNYLQSLLRERETFRAWFNQYFVFEGVDRLLADVALMQHQLGLVMDKTAKPKEIQPIPNDAIVRVAQLVNAQSLHSFFSLMHLTACGLITENRVYSHDSDMQRMDELIQVIEKINPPLVKLRLLLFEVKTNRHSQLAQIRYIHDIQQTVQELNAVIAETREAFIGERCMIQMTSINGVLG